MYELSCEMQVPEVVIWIGGLYIFSIKGPKGN